ncbi:unnamed protein product [Gongylonema pulchrum]|uniref:EGF-like domain-containing protein n=1 Tax=Gongylonema pulchrum TaxID=637853 RepID=A0A3P6RQ91_9BILA|nr:unnamed protein product [Gongylonema pulchrum]
MFQSETQQNETREISSVGRGAVEERIRPGVTDGSKSKQTGEVKKEGIKADEKSSKEAITGIGVSGISGAGGRTGDSDSLTSGSLIVGYNGTKSDSSKTGDVSSKNRTIGGQISGHGGGFSGSEGKSGEQTSGTATDKGISAIESKINITDTRTRGASGTGGVIVGEASGTGGKISGAGSRGSGVDRGMAGTKISGTNIPGGEFRETGGEGGGKISDFESASSGRISEGSGRVDVFEGSGESETVDAEWKLGTGANLSSADKKLPGAKSASSEMVAVHQGAGGAAQSRIAEGVRGGPDTWRHTHKSETSSISGAVSSGTGVLGGRELMPAGKANFTRSSIGSDSWSGSRRGSFQNCTAQDRSVCHELADCIHPIGQCVCRPGYHGDGYFICM